MGFDTVIPFGALIRLSRSGSIQGFEWNRLKLLFGPDCLVKGMIYMLCRNCYCFHTHTHTLSISGKDVERTGWVILKLIRAWPSETDNWCNGLELSMGFSDWVRNLNPKSNRPGNEIFHCLRIKLRGSLHYLRGFEPCSG